MGQFDLQQNFPISGVADLIANRPYKEAMMRSQQQQQLVQGLQAFGTGVQNLVDRRNAMAQALSQADILMRKPEVVQQLGGDTQVGTQTPPVRPVANIAATQNPVMLGQTASPDAAGTPIPNVQPQPIKASSIPANMIAMRDKLASSLQGTKGDDFLKYLKQPEVQETIYQKDAQGNIVGTTTRTVPKGSTHVVVGPQATPSGGSGDAKSQDKLEKDYRDLIDKNLSNRSGGLGLEDGKVNQAIHLRKAINQAYDPKTGQYNIPPSMHSELALGLARLMSPSGTIGVQLEEQLRQKTAREGVANTLISMGFDPKEVGGTTQSVSKFFVNQIDRQGQTAEENRQGYIDQIHSLSPTNLDPKIRVRLDKVKMGNSFADTLAQSQDRTSSGINLQGSDAQRLAELRAKKAAGTLKHD